MNMGVGMPFGPDLEGIQIGAEIDNESFYIGLEDTHKIASAKQAVEYFYKNNEFFYKEYLKQDIDFLMCNIRRV